MPAGVSAPEPVLTSRNLMEELDGDWQLTAFSELVWPFEVHRTWLFLEEKPTWPCGFGLQQFGQCYSVNGRTFTVPLKSWRKLVDTDLRISHPRLNVNECFLCRSTNRGPGKENSLGPRTFLLHECRLSVASQAMPGWHLTSEDRALDRLQCVLLC